MQQEVVLALLAKEPSHGYQLRARLRQALGPLRDAMNDGQVYVTLARLEKAGQVEAEQAAGPADKSDRKVYALTAAGHQRVTDWFSEVSWPRPDLAEFHLKLIAAAAASLADLTRGCSWKASCCGCRLTCAGWKRANGTGRAGEPGHERHRESRERD